MGRRANVARRELPRRFPSDEPTRQLARQLLEKVYEEARTEEVKKALEEEEAALSEA